ncbi:hypothetical protein LTR37_001664 [Vermiconidia calcicola]|uniref:Uncharacterized protein n=1 Tax=Vermiconidia calcicola TaxID=1690605 RepID=A0ACC3NUH4_9PEZI|nr:hypothetical protein LTR37_001664 [Vermiconidia calcicola]
MRIYRSGHPDVPRDLNLTELLHQHAGKVDLPNSHLIAKDDVNNRSLTIGALRNRAGRFANGLQKHFQPPDQARWMMVVPNSVDYVEIIHSVLWLGGVVCPVKHTLVVGETAHAITVARPFAIIVCTSEGSKVLQAVDVAKKELRSQDVAWTRPHIVSAIEHVVGIFHFPKDFLDYTPLPIPHHQDASTRVVTIHLSSGTTGNPKGVELSHHNYVANCFQLYHHDPAQWPPNLRQVASTPYVHIAQMMPAAFFGP